MSNHHAQTALRYVDGIQTSPTDQHITGALVHAELETAEQMERIANQLEIAAVQLGAIKSLATNLYQDAMPALNRLENHVGNLMEKIAQRLGL